MKPNVYAVSASFSSLSANGRVRFNATKRALKRTLPLLLASVLLTAALLCVTRVRQLRYWRYSVVNISNAELLEQRGDGNRQNPAEPRLLKFREHLAPMLSGSGTLQKIIALRHWARLQQSKDEGWLISSEDADSGDVDPEILLLQQRAGMPGACRRFGYVLAGALVSAGIPARVVSLHSTTVGHVMVEAWVEEFHKWVLVDATYDTMFFIDGHYASLLEVRRALQQGRLDSVRFERHGSSLQPVPYKQYFAQIWMHAFVLTSESYFESPPRRKASVWGTRVLHYVDGHSEPYPQFMRNSLLAVAGVLTGCSLILLSLWVMRPYWTVVTTAVLQYPDVSMWYSRRYRADGAQTSRRDLRTTRSALQQSERAAECISSTQPTG